MIAIKSDVTLRLLAPQIVLAIVAVRDILLQRGYELLITAINDGKHLPKSKHYTGEAFDCRTSHINPEHRVPIRDQIAAALGPSYDVILEADHLHIEFDPQTPLRHIPV